MTDFPSPDMQLTHIMVVKDLDRSVKFYRDVLGAKLYREYGGNSAVFDFQGNWLLLVTEGGPTEDKPDVSLVPLQDPQKISHAFTIRVKDCSAAYETLQSRGAEFLTPPYQWGPETRCFFRDPDSYLWEISEFK